MIVQFTIQGANTAHTFRIKAGVYYDNNVVITAEQYNKALAYFQANRKK